MAKRAPSHRTTSRVVAQRRGTEPLFATDESPHLDARTRSVGLAGVARARQILDEQARRAAPTEHSQAA